MPVHLNHTIVAVMLRLARGMRLKETGLLSFQSLSNEMVVGLPTVALVPATFCASRSRCICVSFSRSCV